MFRNGDGELFCRRQNCRDAVEPAATVTAPPLEDAVFPTNEEFVISAIVGYWPPFSVIAPPLDAEFCRNEHKLKVSVPYWPTTAPPA